MFSSDCPTNHLFVRFGFKKEFGCTACSEIQWSPPGSKMCQMCPGGTYGGCGPDNSDPCPTDDCAGPCPMGHYCETDNDLGTATAYDDRYGTPCDLGTYIDYEGASVSSECTTCESDHCEYTCQFCQIDGSCPVSEGNCLIEIDGDPTCLEDEDMDREGGCRYCWHDYAHYIWSNFTLNTECDDLDACTYNDVCDGHGGCAGTPYTCNLEERQMENYPFGTFLCATEIYCLGDNTCNASALHDSSHICRDYQDWCDVLEYCDGSSAECETGTL